MAFARTLKHLFAWPANFSRAWPAATLAQIETAVTQSETNHRAELRFCVEESLPISYLWRNAAARERAVALFGKLRVWDTEENNGVLLYVLHVEHRVELIADRHVARQIPAGQWQEWVSQLQTAYRAEQYAAGTMAVLASISTALATLYPAAANKSNQLPDTPVVIRR